jgi:hypothetical protein
VRQIMLLDEDGVPTVFMKEGRWWSVRAPMSHGGRRRCPATADGVDTSVCSDGADIAGVSCEIFHGCSPKHQDGDAVGASNRRPWRGDIMMVGNIPI